VILLYSLFNSSLKLLLGNPQVNSLRVGSAKTKEWAFSKAHRPSQNHKGSHVPLQHGIDMGDVVFWLAQRGSRLSLTPITFSRKSLGFTKNLGFYWTQKNQNLMYILVGRECRLWITDWDSITSKRLHFWALSTYVHNTVVRADVWLRSLGQWWWHLASGFVDERNEPPAINLCDCRTSLNGSLCTIDLIESRGRVRDFLLSRTGASNNNFTGGTVLINLNFTSKSKLSYYILAPCKTQLGQY
jgi:hypothetical protein